MFMDGQQYAIVAQNLANGKGSFWFPFLSPTWFKAGSNYFLEHPPLVYFIQSLFFKTLGNSIYTERFYSFLTAIISAFLIIRLWKITSNDKFKNLAFLPIFLWIIIPIVFWSYQNNSQENTLEIFTLFSIISLIFFINKNKYIYLILTSIFIFLATLCKGATGLFPLFGFIAYSLSFKNKINISKALKYTLITLLIIILIYVVLMLYKPAYKSLHFYFFDRFIYRVKSEPNVDNRFYILYRLFMELIPDIILVILFYLLFKIKRIKNKITEIDKRYFMFFLLIGVSASIPLIFTKVQKGFYITPSYPFYAIAFSILIKNIIYYFVENILNNKIYLNLIKIISISLFAFSIIYSSSKIGKTYRDNDILFDVNVIGNNLTRNSTITTTKEIYNKWNFQFYLYRKFEISLNHNKQAEKYLLLPKNTVNKEIKGYRNLKIPLKNYFLFVKN